MINLTIKNRKNISVFLSCVLFMLTLSSCSDAFLRAMERGDASVYDYLYFPKRDISKSEKVYELRTELNDNVENQLKKVLETENISDFMDDTETQALLIIKDDVVVFEKYGQDCQRDSIVTSFSVAKSFDSAMIGKLIEQEKIGSVEDSITKYIPELEERDSDFSRIRICDLLNMCSGLSYSESLFSKDDTKTYFDPDLRNLAINGTKIATAPAKKFLYNNYNPLLIGLIIERVSKMTVSEYMEQSIWHPMGAEYDCSWSLDSEEDAFEKMESGINATAIDFARFGCLFRDKGFRNGVQAISKDWILESKAEHFFNKDDFYKDSFGEKIKSAENGGYYSYFWYGLKRPDFTEDDFFAAGNKSQIIYVSPKANMVIVRFGVKDGVDFWKWISAFYNLAGNI